MSHCRRNTLQHEFCFWQMVWSASLMVAAVAMVEMVKAHVAKTFPDSAPLWNTSKPCSDCQGAFSHLHIEQRWKNFMLSLIELDRTINVNFEDRKLLNKRENIIKEWCQLNFATLCILKPFLPEDESNCCTSLTSSRCEGNFAQTFLFDFNV